MKRLARSCLHRSIRNVLQRFQSSSSLHRSSQKLLLHNKMFAVTQWPSTRALTDSDREVVYKHLGSFQGEKKRILSDWAKTNTTSGDQPHKDMQSWFKDIFGQTVDTEFVAKLLRDLIDNHLPLKFEIYGYSIEPLPGFGLPLDEEPEFDDMFPVMRLASQDSGRTWLARTLTIREVLMLAFVEEITNKPEWWRKVKDTSITNKWKSEALSADWSHINRYGEFVEPMADACISELQGKAELYEKTGLVAVFDYSAAAIKSDSLVPPELAAELQAAVRVLEDVPDHQKDWHPGSNEQVLDLVHPSLWPLIYGQSRILTDRTIGVSDCLDYCGVGEVIPKVDKPVIEQSSPGYYFRQQEDKTPNLSHRFQWLPCNVMLEGSKAKIDSYINNLHPVDHANFYPIIEKFIELSLQAWDLVYRWPSEYNRQRITCLDATYTCKSPKLCKQWCTPNNCPRDNHGHLTPEVLTGESEVEGNASDGESDEGFDDEEWDGNDVTDPRIQWFMKTHPMKVSEIPPAQLNGPNAEDVKTSGFFNGSSRIQVIAKLANIHLTPEKPTYDGGSWHLEGRLNEHICATALFYYDSDNITDCRLSFRTTANDEDLMMDLSYEQSDFFSIERTFAIESEHTLQNIGGVLTRPGRSLFFPNIYQHRVSPFKLADPTRPGHRKILALFLVDPAIPVISTANVPPQQQEWWARAAGVNTVLGHSVDAKTSDGNVVEGKGPTTKSRLPVEVADMVVNNVEFPISLKQAKEIRKELIAERKILVQDANHVLQSEEWNFCEH